MKNRILLILSLLFAVSFSMTCYVNTDQDNPNDVNVFPHTLENSSFTTGDYPTRLAVNPTANILYIILHDI